MLSGPKNDARHRWTAHVRGKMIQYALSPYAVKRIITDPERVEGGIAPDTVAAMRRAGGGARKHEVWAMYRRALGVTLIISAWRYPGMSPEGKLPVIPEDVLAALAENQE